MKRKQTMRLMGLLLAAALLVCGCAKTPETPKSPVSPIKAKAADLMEGISPTREPGGEMKEEWADAASDFAVRLIRAARGADQNNVISPLSVLSALSMTALGAKGETLSQMEQVLGMSRDDLKAFYSAYAALLAGDELGLANSVWFKDSEDFTIEQAFLQENADWFGAGVYRAPFDEKTLADINAWVKEKTKEMIPEMLDQIPSSAVTYLINALAFEAKWQETYNEYQVREGDFTREDGTKQKAQLMYSTENLYVTVPGAKGFLKSYEGGRFAFAALLPEEGTTTAQFLEKLDGAALRRALKDASPATVYAAIPKFETKFGAELSEVLKGMGMPLAFSQQADLTGIGHSSRGPLKISRVIHKTFISVAEQGTKAGAATIVEVTAEGAPEIIDPKEVILDRPFVFMLVDTQTMIPFFIGEITDIAG